MKTKISDFEARVLIGWLARLFARQSIRTRASKSNIVVSMLRWPTFLTVSFSYFGFLRVYQKIFEHLKFRETTLPVTYHVCTVLIAKGT